MRTRLGRKPARVRPMGSVYVRMAAAMAVVVAVAALAYLSWTQAENSANVESKVLTEARTLAIEMQAVWDYVDDAQTRINTNSDGTYDFKGVYCSVAGKGIAKRFTRNAEGYTIRYVRRDPRSGTDVPDPFEEAALERFAAGTATEHYRMDTVEGEPVFRYVSLLRVEHNCLDCHGEPAGSIDRTGYLREGMAYGDVAGAVSITIPIAAYEAEAQEGLEHSVAFFCLLAIAIVAVLFWMLHRLVSVPLESANEQLRSESKQKSDFLAVMSHELRTPLASIISFADLWERMPQQRSAEERRLVDEIKQNSAVLLNMVNNSIDVARLDAGRFELTFEEVDLTDVVGAVFASADPIAKSRGVALTKSVDASVPLIWSDWEAVRKVLLNLVGNAVKFTPAGGSVSVAVAPGERPGWVSMEVRDTGCGIDPADQESVFRKFSQAPACDGGDHQAAGGSGLGLFVVRSLAEQLGGSVELESALGEGCRFTVSLPVEGPATAGSDAKREEEVRGEDPSCR